MRFTDTREDEMSRGITIKSTAISMYFEVDKDEIASIKQKTDGEPIYFFLPTVSQFFLNFRNRFFDQLD